MAKRVQFRGGTTLAHATFKGAEREISIDTDKHTVVVHDNVKLGGYPLAKDSDVIKKDSDTGSAKIPVGTTAQRTATPTSGLLRHNSELNRIETYDSIANAWVVFGGQYLGNSAIKAVGYLSNTTNENLVVKAGTTAFAVDNITVGNGGSITIEDGATFKVI